MALWDEDISDFKCCCSLFYTPRRIQSSLSAFLIIMFHRKNSADHPSSDNQPLLQISRQALYQPPSLRQSQEKENCDRWWCGCRQKRRGGFICHTAFLFHFNHRIIPIPVIRMVTTFFLLQKGSIPDICQFWYTTPLLRPIKSTQISA